MDICNGVQSVSIISIQVHHMNEREEKHHLFCQRLQRGVECNLFPGTAHQELCHLSYIVRAQMKKFKSQGHSMPADFTGKFLASREGGAG